MKLLIAAALLSFSAFAQMPNMTDLSKKVMSACKDDKSKVSGCDSYTEVKALKECLMKNESKLSDTCKNSLKMVK